MVDIQALPVERRVRLTLSLRRNVNPNLMHRLADVPDRQLIDALVHLAGLGMLVEHSQRGHGAAPVWNPPPMSAAGAGPGVSVHGASAAVPSSITPDHLASVEPTPKGRRQVAKFAGFDPQASG